MLPPLSKRQFGGSLERALILGAVPTGPRLVERHLSHGQSIRCSRFIAARTSAQATMTSHKLSKYVT